MDSFYTKDNMRFLVNMCKDYLKDKHNIILQQIESDEQTRKYIFDIMTNVHNAIGHKGSLKEKNIDVINNATQYYLSRRPAMRTPVQTVQRIPEQRIPEQKNNIKRIVEPDLPRILTPPIQEQNSAYEKIVNERKIDKITPPTIDFSLATLTTADDPDAFTKKFKELEDQRSLLAPIPALSTNSELRDQVHYELHNELPRQVQNNRIRIINSIERSWTKESRFNFKIKSSSNISIKKIILPDEDMVWPYLLQDGQALIYDSFYLNKHGRGFNILKPSIPISVSEINLTKANGEIVSENTDIYNIENSEFIDSNTIRFYTKETLNNSLLIGDRISLVHLIPHNDFICRLEGHEVIGQSPESNSFDISIRNQNIKDLFKGIALNLSMQLMIET